MHVLIAKPNQPKTTTATNYTNNSNFIFNKNEE